MEAEKKNASPDLSILLRDYMNLRKAERSDWSRYGQQKGTADDLKAVSKALIYLKEHELFSLEDLDTALQGVNQRAGAISKEMKTASDRMKVITAIQTAVADCQTHKAVHDKYIKIGWKTRQAAFAEKHKDELTSYNKAYRMKLADDFGICYDSRQKPSVRPKIREPTPEQRYQQEENRCYKVLTDYFHSLRAWKQQYAPKQPEDEWHPLFVEALQRESYIEYLLDVLLYGTPEEKKALVAEQRKEVMKLEQRFAEHTAEHDRRRSQRKSGLDR